jgi:penicillin-binding protein 1A
MKSVNTVAARLADEVGREAVAETAHRAGIQSAVNTDPAMALGTTLVTPLELTAAYTAFANGGRRVQPYGIERIRSGGRIIYLKSPPQPVQAIGNPALGELHQMMRAVMTGGTGLRAATRGYDLAGKTGTTSDYKDAWFCGYTGDFASCVWMGRDDAKPMVRISGATAPSEMWNRFMSVALKRAGAKPIPPGPPPPEPALPEPTEVASPGPQPQAEPAPPL